MMLMALLEIPVSGWTFFCGGRGGGKWLVVNFKDRKTRGSSSFLFSFFVTHLFQNFIDVHRVSLSPFSLSFRLFLTRTLSFLFRYVVSHFFFFCNCVKCVNFDKVVVV